MYFQITLFNVITLFLIAATLVVTVKRLTASGDSNWPLAYYGLLLTYWRGYMYTLDNYWVIGGVLCGVALGLWALVPLTDPYRSERHL